MRAINMLPSRSSYDVANRNRVDSEYRGYLPVYHSGAAKLPNLTHVNLGNLGHVVALTFGWPISSFSNHVRHIIFGASEKKVVESYALPVITPVKNPSSIWNFSISQHPRHPVRGAAVTRPVAKAPVSGIGEQASRPLPALIRFNHLRPESFTYSSTHGKNIGNNCDFVK